MPRGKFTKASDRLEEDAQAMETRLRQLRVSMLEEKEKRDKELPLKHAGNRWRSAREDRGSMRQYDRDVQQHKTVNSSKNQSKGGSADRPASGRKGKSKKVKKSSSRPELAVLSTATVKQWTVPQVLEWLAAIGLEECQSGFEFHQVTGKILLALEPDKCAQLGITKLSTRNHLLAELEQIRAQQIKKHNGTQNGPTEPAEIIDTKLRDISKMPPTSKLAAKTHWSHVTPLADNAVSSGDGQGPVNLADGEFDEDASHTSFMKALLEWREDDTDQLVTVSKQDNEWINPILSGGQDKIGGALLEGTYDEAEAHNSFQEALTAWRNGEDNGNSGTVTTTVEQIDSGCAPCERKSCWQCYRIVQANVLVHDEQTQKSFCDSSCKANYREQYARYYTS
ncbi:hypothetical protein PHYBOEH_002110 [Phytophthora boehmeriae]|uniref:SAM domain-containing protein n=1 Tax=Phytophthora boehmeriae TaxID=109152 RepID=A0A8T1X6B0_9STRA|nr:hypothetical protein PHYBOEH_002110 [Phytophthora boehmeriae]